MRSTIRIKFLILCLVAYAICAMCNYASAQKMQTLEFNISDYNKPLYSYPIGRFGPSEKDSSYVLIGYYGHKHTGTVQFITKEFPSKSDCTKRVEFIIPNESFVILSISIFTREQWYKYASKL